MIIIRVHTLDPALQLHFYCNVNNESPVLEQQAPSQRMSSQNLLAGVKQLLPALHTGHGVHILTPVSHLLFLRVWADDFESARYVQTEIHTHTHTRLSNEATLAIYMFTIFYNSMCKKCLFLALATVLPPRTQNGATCAPILSKTV